MKKTILMLLLSLFTVTSFAQVSFSKVKKGFYLNPNFNHTSYRNRLQFQNPGVRNQMLFTPNLTVGFLRGNRNRHNISLTSLDGRYHDNFKSMSATLNYSYDILAFRKNKFSFYISPYVSAGLRHHSSEYVGVNGRHRFSNTYASLSTGIAPVFEYKLGKRIDFVASLPLEIYKQQFGTATGFRNNQPVRHHFSNGESFSQGQAKIGLRLNLFRK